MAEPVLNRSRHRPVPVAARLGVGLLLAALPTLAEPASVEPAELGSSELWVDAELGYEDPMFGAPRHEVLGLGLTLSLAQGVELAGGARVAFGEVDPDPGFSGYVRASLCARHRSWAPALGLELEATAYRGSAPADAPTGSFERAFAEGDRQRAIRAATAIAPARWQWRRLEVSFWTLRLITPLTRDAGQRVHIALGVAGLGWRI